MCCSPWGHRVRHNIATEQQQQKENIHQSLEIETHQSQTFGAAQEESALYFTVVHKGACGLRLSFLIANIRLDIVQWTKGLCSLRIIC